MEAEQHGLTGLWLRLVQVAALALVALHLGHLAVAGVFMDEAYYWMWGQHPALSYFDHPPLNAWFLWLSSAVFGWNKLALRLPVALSFLADIGALALFSKSIAGPGWGGYFWPTLLLFLVTPIFWMVSAAAVPDHLLLTGLLFAIVFFQRFFAARAAGGEGASRDLLLGAVALGFAGLAKYNAAFLGLGVGVFVLLFDRALLRQGRLWLAALIAVAMQAPVIIWNAGERFASYEFILEGRHDGVHAGLQGILPFLAGIGIFVSPFLLWPIIRFLFVRKNAVPGAGFARVTFVISTAAILCVSLVTQTLFHWNLAAYAAMLPFLLIYLRPRWLLGLQAVYGTAFAVVAFINYGITPLLPVTAIRDYATAWSYGWEPAAAAVEAARTSNGAGFIAATDYTIASLLGFAMGDRDVTSLSPRTEQYDYWFDAKAHAGEDAILLIDRWVPLTNTTRRKFDSLTQVDKLDVKVGGVTLNTFRIYLAKGFRPDG